MLQVASDLELIAKVKEAVVPLAEETTTPAVASETEETTMVAAATTTTTNSEIRSKSISSRDSRNSQLREDSVEA